MTEVLASTDVSSIFLYLEFSFSWNSLERTKSRYNSLNFADMFLNMSDTKEVPYSFLREIRFRNMDFETSHSITDVFWSFVPCRTISNRRFGERIPSILKGPYVDRLSQLCCRGNTVSSLSIEGHY
jgi:hypothetical protein